jgi:hypothetical protein
MMKMRDGRDLKTKIENEVVVMYDYEYDAVILAHEMSESEKRREQKNVWGGVGMFGQLH